MDDNWPEALKNVFEGMRAVANYLLASNGWNNNKKCPSGGSSVPIWDRDTQTVIDKAYADANNMEGLPVIMPVPVFTPSPFPVRLPIPTIR